MFVNTHYLMLDASQARKAHLEGLLAGSSEGDVNIFDIHIGGRNHTSYRITQKE